MLLATIQMTSLSEARRRRLPRTRTKGDQHSSRAVRWTRDPNLLFDSLHAAIGLKADYQTCFIFQLSPQAVAKRCACRVLIASSGARAGCAFRADPNPGSNAKDGRF